METLGISGSESPLFDIRLPRQHDYEAVKAKAYEEVGRWKIGLGEKTTGLGRGQTALDGEGSLLHLCL